MVMNRAYRRAWSKAVLCARRVSKIPAGVRSKVSGAHLHQLLDKASLAMDATGCLSRGVATETA